MPLLSESLKDVIASVFGSAACVYTGQPFDTIKVRMQCVPSDSKVGAIRCFIDTFQKEGVLSFWRGSLPAFSGALSENVVAFGVNGLLGRIFENYDLGKQKYIKSFITGLFLILSQSQSI